MFDFPFFLASFSDEAFSFEYHLHNKKKLKSKQLFMPKMQF